MKLHQGMILSYIVAKITGNLTIMGILLRILGLNYKVQSFVPTLRIGELKSEMDSDLLNMMNDALGG